MHDAFCLIIKVPQTFLFFEPLLLIIRNFMKIITYNVNCIRIRKD